ncbi:MAG: hypothetical protein EA374_02945 [Acholeplasmatales bacterium]|nr:MAG: hypothetical protein EA374_02945 [Acholeplasmatales bacterium]
MKNLLRWHLHYLFTRKTRVFLLVLCGLNLVVYVMMTRWYEPRHERIIHAEMFARDYAFEVFTFMKTSLVALLTYLGLQLFHMSRYEVLLVQRVGRTRLFISQCIALFLVLWSVMLLLLLQATAVARWFHVDGFWSQDSMMGSLSVMFVQHVMLAACLAVFIQHVLSQFIVWFGYLATEVLVPYGVSQQATPAIAYVLQMLVANAHMLEDGRMTLLLKPRYVLLAAGVAMLAAMVRTLSRDY